VEKLSEEASTSDRISAEEKNCQKQSQVFHRLAKKGRKLTHLEITSECLASSEKVMIFASI
jgi:hypothetical protein